MGTVTYLPTLETEQPSRFDRAVQLGSAVVLAVAGTVGAGIMWGGFCLEGSAVCESRIPEPVVVDAGGGMFNPEATLDPSQVKDWRNAIGN